MESAPGITRQMSFIDGNLFIRKICQLCENSIAEFPARDAEREIKREKASISKKKTRWRREGIRFYMVFYAFY